LRPTPPTGGPTPTLDRGVENTAGERHCGTSRERREENRLNPILFLLYIVEKTQFSFSSIYHGINFYANPTALKEKKYTLNSKMS
jgi:hypothetical protein